MGDITRKRRKRLTQFKIPTILKFSGKGFSQERGHRKLVRYWQCSMKLSGRFIGIY